MTRESKLVNEVACDISKRIKDALEAGISLSDRDIASILAGADEAHVLRVKAQRLAGRGNDPMNKGTSFPIGVGFTRMTKRTVQRLDASVRFAGEAVAAGKEADAAERAVAVLLSGKGTEADKLQKAHRRKRSQLELVTRLLSWKKGDRLAMFTVERVNKDRDGYPASYTISGDGIIKGVQDKVDVVREMFGGDKECFREMVNTAREANAEPSN